MIKRRSQWLEGYTRELLLFRGVNRSRNLVSLPWLEYLESHRNLKNLIVSDKNLRNLRNLIEFDKNLWNLGNLMESDKNLRNLIRIFGFTWKYPRKSLRNLWNLSISFSNPYQKCRILRISCQNNKLIHPSQETGYLYQYSSRLSQEVGDLYQYLSRLNQETGDLYQYRFRLSQETGDLYQYLSHLSLESGYLYQYLSR